MLITLRSPWMPDSCPLHGCGKKLAQRERYWWCEAGHQFTWQQTESVWSGVREHMDETFRQVSARLRDFIAWYLQFQATSARADFWTQIGPRFSVEPWLEMETQIEITYAGRQKDDVYRLCTEYQLRTENYLRNWHTRLAGQSPEQEKEEML